MPMPRNNRAVNNRITRNNKAMNIDNNLLTEITENKMYIMFCNYDTLDECEITEANAINIGSYEQGVIPMGTFMKCPKKKPVTLEWIMNKVNKDSQFINLSSHMSKLLNIGGLTVYPTSYGVGMFRLFGIDKGEMNRIHSFFTDNNIEYSNEYSDARYVYRFKISKKQSNIDIIKKLLP